MALKCSECGSKNVSLRAMAWVNLSTNQTEIEITDEEHGWCNHCDYPVDLEEDEDEDEKTSDARQQPSGNG